MEAELLVVGHHLFCNGVEEVGFSETDAAVDEEGVVGLSGTGGYAHGGRFDELVGGALDKVIKGVARVEEEFVYGFRLLFRRNWLEPLFGALFFANFEGDEGIAFLVG